MGRRELQEPAPRAANPAADPARHRRADRALVVAMLLLVALPPLVKAVLDGRLDGRPQALDLLSTRPSEGAFRRLEAEMERRSWLARFARRHWAPAVDGELERGGSKVVIGRRGWLFYRPALRFVAGRDLAAGAGDARPRQVFDAVVDFHRQLAERGQRLVFVPVPTKPTLYPELLSRRLRAPTSVAQAPNDPAVAPLLARLAAAGVEVVDPLPVLLAAKLEGAEVFLPADTHWSWFGMLRVVEQVAARLSAELPSAPAFDQRRVTYRADGDLLRMLGHAAGAPARRRPMRFEVTQVAGAPDGGGPIRVPASVLVIGDSSVLAFSEPSLGLGRRAGFAERLAFALGRPVDRLATPAGGATRVRRLLALEPQRLAAAEAVVWVMTQRDFRFAADGWSKVDLPAPGEGSVDSRDAPVEGPVVARVLATSRAPERADYADCLMIVRYRLLDGSGRTVDVAHLGWQDFARTRAADLRPGDEVELDLADLPPRWRLDRTCFVDDVGLTSQPRWARSHGLR